MKRLRQEGLGQDGHERSKSPPRKRRKKKDDDPDYVDPDEFPTHGEEDAARRKDSFTIVRKGGRKYVKQCTSCGARHPPCWRKGPLGVGTLCNACGLRWRNKRLVLEPRTGSVPGGPVYVSLIPFSEVVGGSDGASSVPTSDRRSIPLPKKGLPQVYRSVAPRHAVPRPPVLSSLVPQFSQRRPGSTPMYSYYVPQPVRYMQPMRAPPAVPVMIPGAQYVQPQYAPVRGGHVTTRVPMLRPMQSSVPRLSHATQVPLTLPPIRFPVSTSIAVQAVPSVRDACVQTEPEDTKDA